MEELLIFHLQFPLHNTQKYTDFSAAPVDAVGWPDQCFPAGVGVGGGGGDEGRCAFRDQ